MKIYSVKELIESLQGFYSDHKYDDPDSKDVFIEESELNSMIKLSYCRHEWTATSSLNFRFCRDCGESEYVKPRTEKVSKISDVRNNK